MKIAILSFYSGKVSRGVETYVAELAGRLKKNHVVTVFSGGSSPSIESFTFNTLKKLDPATQVVLATNGGWQSFFCRLWCWQHRASLLIPGQSGPGWDDRLNLLCRPDWFVALTNYQAAWAKRNGFGVKVVVIPNGVDLKKFQSSTAPKEIDLPKPLVLCVAALERAKRLDLVVKAVSQLEKASLLLVGQGSQEDNLQKLGDNLLSGRFRIRSFLHDAMPGVYAAADIFTYPTVPWESFGIVVLEALATGLPVVATDDPIRREIVGQAGLFLDPTNTDEYAAKLKEALSTNWGDKPRRQAEKFSWDAIAEKYEELFKSL